MRHTSNYLGFKELTTSFILRRGYKYKNGEVPIVVAIRYQGVKKEINTGLSVLPKNWDKKEALVKASDRKGMAINKELSKIQIEIEERLITMRREIGDFEIDELIDFLKGKSTPQTTVEYLDLNLVEYKSRVGIDLAQTTYYKYRRTSTYFKDFLLEKKSQTNLAVSRIDKVLLEDFFKYLRKEKANSHNSSSALMKCLSSILDDAGKADVIRHNPFKEIQLTRKPVNRKYLTKDEIIALQKLEGLTLSQEIKRDLFLFACFTGLAMMILRVSMP